MYTFTSVFDLECDVIHAIAGGGSHYNLIRIEVIDLDSFQSDTYIHPPFVGVFDSVGD